MIGFEMGQVQGWVRFLVGRPAYQLERVGGWVGGWVEKGENLLLVLPTSGTYIWVSASTSTSIYIGDLI